MIEPVRVRCPRCNNWADIPRIAAATATCNNHTAHHHTRGEHMTIEEHPK
jgi:hypothetical protein